MWGEGTLHDFCTSTQKRSNPSLILYLCSLQRPHFLLPPHQRDGLLEINLSFVVLKANTTWFRHFFYIHYHFDQGQSNQELQTRTALLNPESAAALIYGSIVYIRSPEVQHWPWIRWKGLVSAGRVIWSSLHIECASCHRHKIKREPDVWIFILVALGSRLSVGSVKVQDKERVFVF